MQGLQLKLARPRCCLTQRQANSSKTRSQASLPVEVSVAIQYKIICVALLTG